jgi:Tol biopolymer transport system component
LNALSPVWSPDGRSSLFLGRKSIQSTPSGEFDWWWASLDAREPVPTGAYQLLAGQGLRGASVSNTVAPAPDALPAAWTADGVLFSARLQHSVNLWRVKVSERSGKVIAGSLERLTNGAGSDSLPSPGGKGRIALEVENHTFASLTLPLEPNAGKVLGPIERHSAHSGLVDSRNSLDDAGRFLAYPKSRANETELWVKDLINGQERHLVTTPLSQLNPVISHNATKVAYTVPEGGTISGYVIPFAGGTATKVCDACNLQGWLADNRRILALPPDSARPPGHVRVLDVVDNTVLEVLNDPKSGIGRVDPSPDGRWLSFSSGRHVWIAPLRPGTPPEESEWVLVLTLAEGSVERACGWSPDSGLLYLLLDRDGFRDLYAQHVDRPRGRPVGEPFIVQHLHDPRRVWGSTPYGTAIVRNAFVFTQAELTGSIWLRALSYGGTP